MSEEFEHMKGWLSKLAKHSSNPNNVIDPMKEYGESISKIEKEMSSAKRPIADIRPIENGKINAKADFKFNGIKNGIKSPSKMFYENTPYQYGISSYAHEFDETPYIGTNRQKWVSDEEENKIRSEMAKKDGIEILTREEIFKKKVRDLKKQSRKFA